MEDPTAKLVEPTGKVETNEEKIVRFNQLIKEWDRIRNSAINIESSERAGMAIQQINIELRKLETK